MTRRAAVISRLARAYGAIAPTGRGAYHVARLARALIPTRQHIGEFFVSSDIRLRLDLSTYPDVAMAFGLYEIDTARLIRSLLKPGGHFVDVGANLGYFTMLAARVVGRSGRVDAFEPDVQNRERLTRHVALNDVGHIVTIHPYAACEREQTLDWFHPTGEGTNHGMASSFAPPNAASMQRSQVNGDRVDARVIGSPDLIKVDVEGAELQAIRGMSKLLSAAHAPALLVEHNPESAMAGGFSPAELFDTIVSIQPRYRAFWIGSRLAPVPSSDRLNKIARQGNVIFRV